MYVISETITSANQIFTYDVTSIPALAIDSSWKIESVNSIPDGSSYLVADASIVDEKTFTLKPCNADFSAYVLINLVFLDKVKINRRRRAIELRVDFTTHYIDKAIYIENEYNSDDNLTVHFREPGGEFHYCIVGSEDPLPDITGDWHTVTGITSVRVTSVNKIWIYTTKNEKYSVSPPIHVEIDDTHWDPYTGDDKNYNVGGDIYGLLAGGKIRQVAALENLFGGESISRCYFDLTETNLTEGCYMNLFSYSGIWGDSTSISTDLPATIVPSHAYYTMFRGIRNLYGPRRIDASVLTGSYNFAAMFQGCDYLDSYPKDLKPRVLTPYCYAYMFNGSGVTPSEIRIRATEYAEGCFKGMFKSCYGTPNGIWSQTKPYSHASICEENDTRALPTITATDFYEHSFEKAFADCLYLYTSRTLTLNIHKALERAFYKAFTLEGYRGVSDVTLYSIRSFTNTYTGEIELGHQAFSGMFYYCKNLNNVKNMSLASRSDAQNAYDNWLLDCSSTGTYTYNYYLLEYAYPTYTQADAEKLIRSDYYIPSGWNIVLEDPVTRDYTFEFATGYPEIIDGSLGDVNLGFNIGDGYEGYDRKLTVYCKDQNDASIFYNEYIINSGSYTETPYIVRINPNVTQNDWNFDVSTSLTFYRCGGIGNVENITQNVSMPVDSLLSFATGYPSEVNGSFDSVDVGLLVGDGYNNNTRTINLTCYDIDQNLIFNSTYTLDSSSYKQTPYVVRITPNFISKNHYIDVHATLNVGYVSNSTSASKYVTVDNTFNWVSGYPRLTNNRSLRGVDLGMYIGDGYGGKTRTLHVICKNENNSTVFDRTYNIDGSYKASPYTLHISPNVQDSNIVLNVYAYLTFGTYDPIELNSVLNMYINTTFQTHTGYPSLVVDGSLGSVNLGYDIGNGYPTYQRILNISATTNNNRSVFNKDYIITGSYEKTPYKLNIKPNVWIENSVLNLTSSLAFKNSSGEDVSTVTNKINVNPQFDYSVTFGSDNGNMYNKSVYMKDRYIRGRLAIDLDFVGLGIPTGSRTVDVTAKYSGYSGKVFNYTITLDPSVTEYFGYTTFYDSYYIGRTLVVTTTVSFKGTGGDVITTRTNTKSYTVSLY